MADIVLWSGEPSPDDVRLRVPGSFGAAGDVTVNATGVSSAALTGNVTVTADANVTATGVSSPAQVGSVTVTANASTNASGVTATGTVGSVTVTGSASVSATGVSSAALLGNVSVTADANTSPTSVSAAAQIGDVTVTTGSGDVDVLATGVSSNCVVGVVTVDTGLPSQSADRVGASGGRGTLRHLPEFKIPYETVKVHVRGVVTRVVMRAPRVRIRNSDTVFARTPRVKTEVGIVVVHGTSGATSVASGVSCAGKVGMAEVKTGRSATLDIRTLTRRREEEALLAVAAF